MMQRREPERAESSRMATGGGETSTPHERYAEALSALTEAESRVRAIADRLSALGHDLTENPLTLAPLHEDTARLLPLHITTHPFRTQVDMADWPDASIMIQALAALHQARSRVLMLRAWMLPKDRDATSEP